MPEYLDSNATTRCDARVAATVMRYLTDEFGNAGSRTHEWGARAKKAVEHARDQIADVGHVDPTGVVFTSGATESNNLALLGLEAHGVATGRRHVIVTAVEHKAVLEPAGRLGERGFDVDVLPVDNGGYPSPDALAAALRDDTLAVSTMHVNNETGVELPLDDYSNILADSSAFWHVDAAQSFGKRAGRQLANDRIDLISVSAHKVYGPKGVGALLLRLRNGKRPPLAPLMVGGGQERGLRPGTVPVALVAGLGHAAALAAAEMDDRDAAARKIRDRLLSALTEAGAHINGDPGRLVPHVVNTHLPGIDAEAFMLASRDLVAISNGSACTSATVEPSHVLLAMGYDRDHTMSSVRISWDHDTDSGFVEGLIDRIAMLA